MAVTENSYTGNGSTTNYSFTFPYLKSTDVQVQVDATVTTAWTFHNATTVKFNTAPADGAKIKILRKTNVDSLTATFYPGSAIKSEDLNDNYTQNLYSTQETSNRAFETTGGTITGNVALGEDVVVSFEGATDNAHETTITVADPTADRTITLPNVTGTVVTTGDTATVTATMLAANSVDSSELVDGSIDTSHIADSQVTTAKIAADAVTGAKIADNQINSEHYVDGSVDTAHIADLNVTTAKIAADAITGAKIADDVVDSEHLAADSIDTEHYAPGSVDATALASNAVTNAKIADDSVGADELIDSSIGTAALASNAVTLDKMADNSVGTSELVDTAVTTAKLANNAVTTVKITDSNVTTAKINNDAVTQDKLADDSVGTPQLIDASVNADRIASGAVTTAKIADNAVTSAKIAANAVTTTEIADAELTTLAGMQSGTASILASGTALAATTTEINRLCDGMDYETTISNTDVKYPTSGAVVDYVAAQIAPIGGLEVIATDAAFPNTQPEAGVVISIADAGGLVVNGSGTSTTGRTVGGSTVTINNINSQFNSTTIEAGVAMMVSSTGSGQIYNYHKATLREQDILSIASDIQSFGNRYRVASSAPTSSKDDGDLWFDTSNGKMMVYNDNTSAWEEVSAIGSFNINTISSSGNTGGGSATFNGTAYRFVLSNPPQDAQQLIVSINGVIQKPNAGTSQPSEGFAISGNDIIFAAAPASGSDYFITTLGQSVQIGTPSDNTISTAKIQNLAVTGDKVATNLDLADNKKIRFGTGNDLELYHDGSHSYIEDTGTGNLYIDANQFYLRNNDSSNVLLQTTSAGVVQLKHNGTTKFETTSTGVSLTGDIKLRDNDILRLGDTTYGDLKVYHTGSANIIDNAEGHTLHIRYTASEEIAKFIPDGAVELYYDNSKKLETASNGINVTGKVDLSGHLYIADSQKAYFGAGPDLEIFHDGSHSRIKNATGSLISSTSIFKITNANVTENMFVATEDGAVELYHDNSKKLETISNGVRFLDSDANLALQLDTNSGTQGYIYADSNQIQLQTGGGETSVKCIKDEATELYYDNSKKCETQSDGFKVNGALHINHTGFDTLFNYASGYNYITQGDDKTTYFRNESNTIRSRIDASGHYRTEDNIKLVCGTGEDLQIYHDGSHSFIQKSDGAGTLYLDANGIIFRGANAETLASFTENSAVDLYYNNSKKFETTSAGVSITGTSLHTDNIKITVDNGTLWVGAGDDLGIYHDGTNSIIKNNTGELKILADEFRINNAANNEQILASSADGDVELFYNGAKKLETVTDGIRIWGAEGGQAAINFEADEGDDHNDIWQFAAHDGNAFTLRHKDGNVWRNAFDCFSEDHLARPVFRGPGGGIRFDDNMGSMNGDKWNDYAGDGHLHRTDGQAYLSVDDHFRIRKNGAAENKRFDLRTDTGNGNAQNDWQDDQFDFAEFFEWSDGNPSNEDRIGHTVTVDGLTGKIKIATEGDAIIGVVSGTAAFTANCAAMGWHGKYIRDEWGRYRFDLVKDADGNQLYSDANNKHEKVTMVENPDWDQTQEYYTRDERKEWDKIGIIGQCYVRKTAVKPSSWIKLKEVDSTKDFYLIK